MDTGDATEEFVAEEETCNASVVSPREKCFKAEVVEASGERGDPSHAWSLLKAWATDKGARDDEGENIKGEDIDEEY